MNEYSAIKFYGLIVAKGIPFSTDTGFISEDGVSLHAQIPDYEAHRLHRMNANACEVLKENLIDAWEVATHLKIITYTYLQIRDNADLLKSRGIYCDTQFEYLKHLLKEGGMRVNYILPSSESESQRDLRRAEFFLELIVGVHSKNLIVGSQRKVNNTTAQMIPSAIVPEILQPALEWAMRTVNGITNTFDASVEDALIKFEELSDEHMPTGPEPDAEENNDDPTRGVY
tara:strand:- start:1455 stop:2141 length:687 start_codon:yes stop_codon:yes gene_type:complete